MHGIREYVSWFIVSTNRGDRSRESRTKRSGKYVRTTDTAQRDAEAARLRSDGLSYQQIADKLGYSHRENARRAVSRALLAIVAEPAEDLRALELARLDQMWIDVLEVLRREHVTVSHGRVIYSEETGQPIIDDGPVLSAIDRLLRIQDRRAKLLGLDAPSKHEVVTIDAIDAEIAKLEAEQAALGEQSGGTEAGKASEAPGTSRGGSGS
jgi:hypothetical protein